MAFKKNIKIRMGSILIIFLLLLCCGISFSEKQEFDGLELSLTECINIALRNNLDIKLETLDVELREHDIEISKSSFDPYLSSQVYYINSTSANTYVLEEVSKLETKTIGETLSVSQKLPLGTSYDISLSSYRRKYTASLQGLNPTYDTNLTLSLNQPLLKDLGSSVNKVYVTLALNNKRISLVDLEDKMSEIIFSVIRAYWNLTYAVEDLKAKERSLSLAKELLEINKTQIEVGTLAPVEIYQAESAVAARDEKVIISRNVVLRTQDNLVNIMNMKESVELLKDYFIKPVESLSPDYVNIDLAKCVNRALVHNHDLIKSKIYLESADIQTKYNQNQLLPDLDLSGGLSFDGIAGRSSFDIDGYPFEGGYGDAFDEMLKGDYYSYNIYLNFDFPLLNREARSSLAKSRIEKRKQLIQLKQLENQIILGVKNYVRSIETNKKRIKATSAARLFAEKKLEVEQEKLKLGLTTNYMILDFQEDLTIAMNSEVKAKIDYQLSKASLKSLEGTLLDDYEFLIEKNMESEIEKE